MPPLVPIWRSHHTPNADSTDKRSVAAKGGEGLRELKGGVSSLSGVLRVMRDKHKIIDILDAKVVHLDT